MELSQNLLALFLALLPWLHSPIIVVNTHSVNSLVLLVSFDGFRWDYLDMVEKAGRPTPTFDMIRQTGVVASSGVNNAFLTKTFPNHYTIATGLYEENHGVVANTFYDPVRQVLYNAHNDTQRFDPYFWNNGSDPDADSGAAWKGEPIWITNQKGTTSRLRKSSGVMMWPGGDVQLNGQFPSRYQSFTRDMSNRAKIDQVISWFTDEFMPINLGLLYIDEPDFSGHHIGPDAAGMIDVIVELDGVLKYLIEKLLAHHLFEKINLIITSDHGMATINDAVILEDYVNATWYMEAAGSPVEHIWPHEGKEEAVYQKLKDVPHLTTYRKGEIPPHYHYSFNNRVPPILIVADEGFNICNTHKECDEWPTSKQGGNHGYNNSLPDMRPFFIAKGPAFKEGYKSPKLFNNVDIYPLLCHMLDLEPAHHDGSLKRIKHLLDTEADSDEEGEEGEKRFFTTTVVTFLLVMVFAALFSGVWCVAACRTSRIHTRRLRIPISLSMNGLHQKEGATHLLTSDEDEIP